MRYLPTGVYAVRFVCRDTGSLSRALMPRFPVAVTSKARCDTIHNRPQMLYAVQQYHPFVLMLVAGYNTAVCDPNCFAA